jgi:diketogulonate reductase-like aldo/keto reductase
MHVPHVTLSNGVRMPMLGLGTWNLRGEQCTRAVKAAVELGYEHIDTAVQYDNHADIGRAFTDIPRQQLFITTKVWRADLEYADVLRTCHAALADIGTDHIDLLLIHWPNRAIPMRETLRALKALCDENMVRAVGVSNFAVPLLCEALEAAEEMKLPITVNQVEFHPYLYQQELLLFCRQHNVHLTAYSPLAKGKVNSDPLIAQIAKKHGKTPGQMALRWLLDKHVSIIPKASSSEHLGQNIDLDFKLTKEDAALLDSLPQDRICNPGWSEF